MVGGTSWAVLECSTLDAPTLGPGYAGTGGILFADRTCDATGAFTFQLRISRPA